MASWKQIADFPMYEVSDDGRVRSQYRTKKELSELANAPPGAEQRVAVPIGDRAKPLNAAIGTDDRRLDAAFASAGVDADGTHVLSISIMME